MSLGNILEMAIIAFIVLAIALIARRNGRQNPIDTGSLDGKINALSGDVMAVKSEVAGVKTKVGEVVQRVEGIEEAVASVADIKRLEKAIERVAKVLPDIEARQRALSDKLGERAEASAAVAAKVDHIDRNLTLIMSVVVPKGMEK